MKTHACLLAGPLALFSLTFGPGLLTAGVQPGDPPPEPEVRVVYVDDSAPGWYWIGPEFWMYYSPDGLSWETAFNNLEEGLIQAENLHKWGGVENVEVWVAQGYYEPQWGEGGGQGGCAVGEEPASRVLRDNGEPEQAIVGFRLPIGIPVRGGYRGAYDEGWGPDGWDFQGWVPLTTDPGDGGDPEEGPDPADDRDWRIFETILAGNGDTLHVVTMEGTGEEDLGAGEYGLLEGFYIQGGNADGQVSPEYGHSLTSSQGGGIYLVKCSPTLRDLEIRFNYAAYQGGGLYARDGGPILENVTFWENWAALQGGAACFDGGETEMEGLRCEDNWAGNYGGAFHLNRSGFFLTNGVFLYNQAGRAGGAIYAQQSHLELNACTLTLNQSARSGQGGALYLDRRSELWMENSILWQNQASRNPEIYAATPKFTSVFDCLVRGGYAGGTRILKLDPKFVNCEEGDLHLQPNSPAIGLANDDTPEEDCEGEDRDGDPDLGAYECGFSPK